MSYIYRNIISRAKIEILSRPSNSILTDSIDNHGLVQLLVTRIRPLAGVFAGLLLLERIKEQGQTMILVQLGVHGRLGVARVRAVKNNVIVCGKRICISVLSNA